MAQERTDTARTTRRTTPSGETRRALRSQRAPHAAHDPAPADGPTPRKPRLALVVAAVALLAAAVFVVQMCATATPIAVTVNGTQYNLRGAKTMQVAIKESGLPVNPGDLISLQGNVLERGAGDPFFATVGEEETADPDYQLHDGDVVTLTDGHDVVEPYDAVEQDVPFGVSVKGIGAIRTFSEGADGVKEIRTGQLSGEVVEKVTVEPQDLTQNCVDPNVGNDKVLALTFDDGPSSAYTEDILDILAANEAKATFFCVGTAVENGGADIVLREAAEGHQILTHSYDNAASANGDMSLLSADEQVAQIERGLQALQAVLGYEPARYVRLGSNPIPESAMLALAPSVSAEIGWTLDTGDWVYMAQNDIYDVLMSAKPGYIIRMHDGGDQRDATVAALKRALPKLRQQGFSFVTIDELMSYVEAD